MFDELSAKLDSAFARFRGRGILDEAMIAEGMREVRRALLEADVHFKVAKDFCARVEEKARGQEVAPSVTPAQQVIKIVHDELVDLLGGAHAPLADAKQPPTVIVLAGLQGSGRRRPRGSSRARSRSGTGVRFWWRPTSTGRRRSISSRRSGSSSRSPS